MSEPQQYRIPNEVSLDDFLPAIKPLLDLLGVHDKEVYADLHITGTPRNDVAVGRISFTMVAPRKGTEDAEYPEGVEIAEPRQEHAEHAYFVSVDILP